MSLFLFMADVHTAVAPLISHSYCSLAPVAVKAMDLRRDPWQHPGPDDTMDPVAARPLGRHVWVHGFTESRSVLMSMALVTTEDYMGCHLRPAVDLRIML